MPELGAVGLWLLVLQPWLWAAVTRIGRLDGALFPWIGLWLLAGLLAGLVFQVGGSAPLEWRSTLLPGVGLRADGPALLFCLLSLVLAMAALSHARGYFRGDRQLRRRLWPLLWVLLGALNLVWLAADFLLIYLGMEVVALCVVTLIALSGLPDAIRAAMDYLQAVLLGTLALLLGAGLLVMATGTFATTLPAGTAGNGLVTAATLLIVGGLAYRAALFPLHTWLPPAHGYGHAPVSAILSALVTKASFYILARFWLDNHGAIGTVAVANLLGVMGALAVIWGGWMALRQTRLKMLVAYSSVNQVGYLFLFFPLVAAAASANGDADDILRLARDGALLQVVSHALAKAALFMAAGNLALMIGSGQIANLAGISRQMPLALVSFGVAGVSIMGLPPSGGFMAKWYLMQSSLMAGQWWWALVLLAGGLLSAGYLFRVFRVTYLEREDGGATAPARAEPLALMLNLAPLLLALLAAGLGVFSLWPLELVALGGGGLRSAE